MVNGYVEWTVQGAPLAEFADYQTRAKLRGETRRLYDARAGRRACWRRRRSQAGQYRAGR